AVLPSSLNSVRGSVRPQGTYEAVADVLNRHQVWGLENDSHCGLQFTCELAALRQCIDPQRLGIIGAWVKSLGPAAPYG
ncbi:PLP-dependent aminotransferase family protein, partial [Pseudomonas syringae pv. tagetis]